MPYVVQFGTVLDSIGKPNVNFYYTLLSLGITVVFNLVFISLMGVYGAAVGTLLAYTFTFIIMQIYLYNLLKVNPLKPFEYMVDFYKQVFYFVKRAIENRNFMTALREES